MPGACALCGYRDAETRRPSRQAQLRASAVLIFSGSAHRNELHHAMQVLLFAGLLLQM